MEPVVDFEQLCGSQNQTVVKELSVAGHIVLETFQFQSPHGMRAHGSCENGPNWYDGHIPYTQLASLLNEAAAGFAHLYAYGILNVHLFHNYWAALCIISKISSALHPATSDLSSVVPIPVTEIPLSGALLDTRIPSTIG